jgi:transaldolase
MFSVFFPSARLNLPPKPACVSLFLDPTADCQSKRREAVRQDFISQIVTVFRNYGLSAQVLLTGIRSPQEVRESVLEGRHICAFSFAMFHQLFDSSFQGTSPPPTSRPDSPL